MGVLGGFSWVDVGEVIGYGFGGDHLSQNLWG
jgi:hypothetical protein